MAGENLTTDQIRQAVSQGIKDGLKDSGKGSSSLDPTAGSRTAQLAQAADKGVATGAGLVEKAFSNAAPTVGGFTGQLGALSENLGSKGLTGTINSFGGTLESNINVFRSLSGAGIDFGDSILDAQRATATARLPMELFGKTVKENSFILAQMGGSASLGAKKFADVSGLVMAGTGKELAKLGFSMDEIAEGTASYMEIMQRNGLASKMTNEQLAAGAGAYNMELDKLAKATGISRKALDEQNAAAARDLRMRNAMAALMEKDPTGKLAAEVQAEIARLKQADPSGKLAAGMVDSITSGGNAITKEARDYQLAMRRNGQDAAKVTRDVFEGNAGSVAALRKANDDAAASAREKEKQDRRLVGVYSTMNTDNMLTASARMGQLGNATEAMAKAQDEQAAKLKSTDPTRTAAGLDQTLTEVQNKFKTALIDSKVLDVTASGMTVAGEAAKGLADGFNRLSSEQKIAALAGAGIAKEILSILTESKGIIGGIAGYTAAKIAEGKAKKIETPDVEGKGTKPGTPEKPSSAPEGKSSPGKKAAKAGKWIIIGGIAYYVLDIVDDATGLNIIPGPSEIAGKITGKPVEPKETKLSIDEEREREKQRFLEAQKNMTVSSPTMAPSTLVPTATTKASEQTEKLNNTTKETKDNVQSLNDATKSINFANLTLPENVSVSLENGNNKLRELKTNIVAATNGFADLNNVSLDKLNETINKLNESMTKLTQKATQPFDVKPQGDAKVSTAAPQVDKEVVDLLNQLNMNMGRLVSHQSEAVDYLSKTAKNTRNAVGNMLT